MSQQPGARLKSPATQRNREPILEVLRDCLPTQGKVLEIASGSGEHALYFAWALPGVIWQPTDSSHEALASIDAWRATESLDNLLAPQQLDVVRRPWPVDDFDAIVCINMVHISPWEATEALLAEAGARLPAGGVLYLYGPYKRGGQHTASSNEAFDADLRWRNPEWGIRDLNDVVELAEYHGIEQVRVVEMPANNLSVVLQRRVS
ncbi:DUF938 domain-containing protein [Aidingimonas halophila]|uniref:SAM-dependent methyltransferase n=1 Tax=Aidingimonas halophila TaxID=574349 RepID=A0A1H2TX68_9GAMM|nr:DUF938 domain-containing protein [Aidingimonas halophila]GHC38621.1 SAM-dependent methyltransferase [Aidingimonas halophila]SDW48381.1 Protein of unknown function [Aidingimonas halophila]